jgi:hypothetical protein
MPSHLELLEAGQRQVLFPRPEDKRENATRGVSLAWCWMLAGPAFFAVIT